MLLSEAVWLKKNIEKYVSVDFAPVLNLGSSTLIFRTKINSCIDELVIKPIERRTKSKVIHSDYKKDIGVDLCGDIYNKNFQNTIIEKKFKTIICTSLLEQVEDPVKAISIIGSLVANHGLIFLTVPRRFPYHPDPIDIFFRPTQEELFSYFDQDKFILLEKELIADQSYFSFLLKRPKLLLNRIVRIFTPFYQFQSWKRQMTYLPHYFKKLQQSCIIVRRIR